MEDAGVARVKVWNTDGMVVFSNDPEQVGGEPELEEDLLEAFEGEVASEISDLDEPENASERLLADELFETYVPVNLSGDAGSDEVYAVIEVYQDYSTIQLEIDHLNDVLKITLGIGLLVLYVLLLPVMVGTTRTLRRQNAQLAEQADQLGVLLAREQETVAELRELDRLKSDFAAAASHELRTPLTTIHGFAELLKSRPSDDPETRDAVEAIARQTSHLQRLVGNLLREAQLEHGGPETREESTSVAQVLQDVRDGFPGSLGRIRITADPDLPLLTLDPVSLARDRREPGRQRAEVLDARCPRRRDGRDRRRRARDPRPRRGSRDPFRRPPADLRSLLAVGRFLDQDTRRRRIGAAPRSRAHASLRRGRRGRQRAREGDDVHRHDPDPCRVGSARSAAVRDDPGLTLLEPRGACGSIAPMDAHRIKELERSFRRAGVPTFIRGYSARRAFAKALPLLTFVFVVEVLNALNDDFGFWTNVGFLAGGVAIALGIIALLNVCARAAAPLGAVAGRPRRDGGVRVGARAASADLRRPVEAAPS